MNMAKILVTAKGLFIGDVLFATSVAESLHRRILHSTSGLLLPTHNEVHFSLDLMQPLELLRLHPYIDKAFYSDCEERYDEVIDLKPLANQSEPATIQFQQQAKIDRTHTYYSVFTNFSNDYAVDLAYKKYREGGKKIVVYQNNWEERTFGFTKAEYWRGQNIAPVGYGGRRRNIQLVLDRLAAQKDLVLIPVGKEAGYNQRNADIYSSTSYAFTASLIKMADVFIGSEGGLSNCAAGVNTRCIITTDFIAQLYGANGCIGHSLKPAMGPATYFPERGHVHLDPYLPDNEVAEQILYYINNPEKYHMFDWNTL